MLLRVKNFTTSYCRDNFLKIDAFPHNVLVISGKGSLRNGYTWIRITDSHNNLIKDFMIAADNDGSFYRSEYVPLEAGVYKVIFLSGLQPYGYFTGSLPEIHCMVENGETKILLPETYIKNAILFLAGRKGAGEKYLGEGVGIQCKDKKIIELAKSITAEAHGEYEKIRAVHDWVAQNIEYDAKAFFSRSYNAGNQDALRTLNSGKAVCQGYSNLTAALLRAVNIKTGITSGICLGYGHEKEWNQVDKNRINHVWNEAYADGRWIIMDVAWDSGYIGSDKAFHPRFVYSYFDISLEMLSYDHLIMAYDA